MKRYDAIIVGSGINGLVASAMLARAGWSVAIVESQSQLGGFISSGERTIAGYTHDTYSSWHPLFQTGNAYSVLGDDLARYGLEYANTDGPIAAGIGTDGRAFVADRDAELTANSLESGRDRVAYRTMLDEFNELQDVIGVVLGSELTAPTLAKQAMKVLWRKKLRGTELFVRDLVSSGAAYLERRFEGWEVDRTWAPWLLHGGLGPEHASGGLMIPVFAATLHGAGMPIVRGGASNFVRAFEGVLRTHDADIFTGTPVDQIVVRNNVATGVVVGGETLLADRAVIASVVPTALYGGLLRSSDVPDRVRAQAATYRYGRGAMQIHLALSSPLRWTDDRLGAAPLIHINDGARSIAVSTAQASAGLLPATPTIVVGQQSLLDPGRAPQGGATLWVQLQEVPYAPRGDAAGQLDVRAGWTASLAEAYADRVVGMIAAHAPGAVEKIVGREIITPVDLERANANAVRGDPYAGAGELDQNLLWRPVPAASRHATGIRRLWHVGGSTHPGPGLGGGSGYLVAEKLVGKR